jgi:hypothetical protein
MLDVGLIEGDAAERESRALHELEEVFGRRLRIIYKMYGRIDTSRRLCGGILVAIPTAMPSVPFRRRFGSAAGSTRRLLRVAS